MSLNADIVGMILGWGILTWLFIVSMKAAFSFIAKHEKDQVVKTQKRRDEAQHGFGEIITACERELQEMHTYKPEVSYEDYLEYLDSPEWKKKRAATIKRDKSTCQQCGNKFPDKELEVHHIHYKRLKKEQPEDLITLCEFHHELLHDFHGEKAGYYPVLTMSQLTTALRDY